MTEITNVSRTTQHRAARHCTTQRCTRTRHARLSVRGARRGHCGGGRGCHAGHCRGALAQSPVRAPSRRSASTRAHTRSTVRPRTPPPAPPSLSPRAEPSTPSTARAHHDKGPPRPPSPPCASRDRAAPGADACVRPTGAVAAASHACGWGGRDWRAATLVAGVLWVVAFFVVRILPSPFMVYKMVYGSYAAYSTFDFGLAVATTPLPFVLNSYW
eukprot:5940161-Prymnesium_polylepis.1